MRAYVGITGLSGTGKDTVADILASLALARGWQVFRYRLSDEILAYLAQQGITAASTTRGLLIETGNEMRDRLGQGILASRIAQKVELIQDDQNPGRALVMAVGIRQPEEVRVLRAEWGVRFRLVAVQADPLIRANRKAQRHQYCDDVERTESLERADQDIGILACVSMADQCLINNDSREQLNGAVAVFFAQCVAPFLEGNSDKA